MLLKGLSLESNLHFRKIRLLDIEGYVEGGTEVEVQRSEDYNTRERVKARDEEGLSEEEGRLDINRRQDRQEVMTE